VRLPPPGYLAKVADACRRTGTLFVLDEIQTGLGRTGALLACQDEDVVPDVLLLAKALSGGLVPAACYLTRPELWRAAYGTLQACELHCTTYRGGPLACAAARRTVDAIVEQELSARARRLGERRGQGQGLAGALAAQWIVVGLLERGYVTQVCTLAPTVVRVEPPLIVTEAQLVGLADALAETLREHASGRLQTVAGVATRLAQHAVRGGTDARS
jgi:putrescine aminotransferase